MILAGTNDIAGNTGPMSNEEIEGNIASMAELAKLHGIRVVLSSILPISAYHAAPNRTPQTLQRPMSRIKAINDWMKAYAAKEKHVYLDYWTTAMVDETGHLRDGTERRRSPSEREGLCGDGTARRGGDQTSTALAPAARARREVAERERVGVGPHAH